VLVKLPHTNPDDFIGNNVGENEVVIPLVMSSESKGCAVNIPFRKTMTLKAKKIHGYELGFTIIFHKIQGQTCDKLIVDLNKRPSQPQVTFATFYVAISRVRRSSVLRLLPLHHRDKNLSHLLTLKAPKELNTWLAAYNPRNGMWHPKRIKEDNDQNSEEKSILKSTKKNYKKKSISESRDGQYRKSNAAIPSNSAKNGQNNVNKERKRRQPRIPDETPQREKSFKILDSARKHYSNSVFFTVTSKSN
jgi:hypothetical protein